jgi:NAD(P) transhydrogenase subunit alpha
MKVAVLKENKPYETRVAATPETVRKMVELGCAVCVQAGAGEGASISDAEFAEAGARVSAVPLEIIADADIVLKLQPSEQSEPATLDELALMKQGAILIGMLSPYENSALIRDYAAKSITAFAMEFVPRITRAQGMDVLSSQSNLAGYKSVLDAVSVLGKAVPMMMTAAGTIAPARALILGAGVAGLQAIATAKRLGAIVSAFDVRPAAREQVESLGANFIEVPSEESKGAETSGGYAKEMSSDYKQKQQLLIHETLKKQDIVITTALIPGKPAPLLITEAMVADMKCGAVIVDMATASGGNCAVSKKDEVVMHHGVTVIGYSNIAARIPADASKLYAKNLLNFMMLLIDKETRTISINREDEIIKGALLTMNGEIVHPALKGI